MHGDGEKGTDFVFFSLNLKESNSSTTCKLHLVKQNWPDIPMTIGMGMGCGFARIFLVILTSLSLPLKFHLIFLYATFLFLIHFCFIYNSGEFHHNTMSIGMGRGGSLLIRIFFEKFFWDNFCEFVQAYSCSPSYATWCGWFDGIGVLPELCTNQLQPIRLPT